jgi:hypothetical protein
MDPQVAASKVRPRVPHSINALAETFSLSALPPREEVISRGHKLLYRRTVFN